MASPTFDGPDWSRVNQQSDANELLFGALLTVGGTADSGFIDVSRWESVSIFSAQAIGSNGDLRVAWYTSPSIGTIIGAKFIGTRGEQVSCRLENLGPWIRVFLTGSNGNARSLMINGTHRTGELWSLTSNYVSDNGAVVLRIPFQSVGAGTAVSVQSQDVFAGLCQLSGFSAGSPWVVNVSASGSDGNLWDVAAFNDITVQSVVQQIIVPPMSLTMKITNASGSAAFMDASLTYGRGGGN